MMSRLNQLNNRLAPSVVDGALRVRPAAFGYRVPSSPMPRTALRQPDHRQPTAAEDPVLTQGFHRVLTARRREPTRGQSQRRDVLRYSSIRKMTTRRAIIGSPSSTGAPSLQRRPQLLFEPGRDRVAATGQRADDDPVGRIQLIDHRSGHVPKPPSNPVPLHRSAHRLGDHQPYPRTAVLRIGASTQRAPRCRAAPPAPLD